MESIAQKVNSPSHLYGTSRYGHFSQITSHNQDKFPLFKKASPLRFTLNKGDSLYIPSNWWHWVKSYGDRSISVNFWFKTNTWTNDPPTKYSQNINWPAMSKWTNQYLTETADKTSPNGIWIWIDHSYYRRMTMSEFITTYSCPEEFASEKFAYLVTIKDYEDFNFPEEVCVKNRIPSNRDFLTALGCDIEVPFPEHMLDSKYNFWMNFGKENGIDSGLHYDEEPGLLCVVDGIKEVILYPPSDTEFLYPYPLNPPVLKPNPNYFHYNLYRQAGPIDPASSITSSKFLEITLVKAPNVARIASILQEKYGPGRIVYGIKNCEGMLRWEFYFYGMDMNLTTAQIRMKFYSDTSYNSDMAIDKYLEFHKSMFENDYYDHNKIDKTGLIVYSIDLTEEGVIDGMTPCINLYYVITETVEIPFILHEKTLYRDSSSHVKSIQYIDTFSNILFNANSLRKWGGSVGLGNIDLDNLYNFLNNSPYKCATVAIVNKGMEMGIYLFGIVYRAFLLFLIEYNYPPALISEVSSKEEEISKMQLEVGFHFKRGIKCHIPSRTAFYGLF